MKFQTCTYQETVADDIRLGIAKLVGGFNSYYAEFIIDCETGRKLPSVFRYTLRETPLSYIDTDYRG